jgi:HAMP domain-containing protein
MTTTQSTADQKTKRTFVSLRLKILVGFTLIFSAVFAGAFIWFLNFATDQALTRIKQDLLDTLKGAAAGVNGDELVALYENVQPNADGFSDDPLYINQLDWLQKIHDLEPRAWPYTYVMGEKDHEVIFIADLWVRYNKDKAAPFKYSYISGGSSWGGLSALSLKDDLNPYTDEFGSWISAYQPVQDSEGKNVGAIGIDFEASYVDQVRQAILDKMVIAFCVTYALLFVLVYLASGVITSPIVKLTKVAEHIGKGDYTQDLGGMLGGSTQDEISTLTHVFQFMVDKVREREQKLIERVEELKIEINETKRKAQVSEIVDSDFFRELQAKSRVMRRRSKGEADDEGNQAQLPPAPPEEPKSTP